jgi:hypothetical protein
VRLPAFGLDASASAEIVPDIDVNEPKFGRSETLTAVELSGFEIVPLTETVTSLDLPLCDETLSGAGSGAG